MEAADAKVMLTWPSILGEEVAFEGITAAEVEEEEVFEVDGADVLGGVICEHWEGEGEEVQGDGDGDGNSNAVEVVFSGEGVGLEGTCRGVGEEEVKKGLEGRYAGDGWDAGGVVGAGEAVDGVEDVIEDVGGGGDWNNGFRLLGHGFGKEVAIPRFK
ncbi:hypothetical protein K439DRAFT_1617086 [Ramaria rubella]|nr:hypothetical protein K439DRAFT_1617086 [Ramaria rubella]